MKRRGFFGMLAAFAVGLFGLRSRDKQVAGGDEACIYAYDRFAGKPSLPPRERVALLWDVPRRVVVYAEGDGLAVEPLHHLAWEARDAQTGELVPRVFRYDAINGRVWRYAEPLVWDEESSGPRSICERRELDIRLRTGEGPRRLVVELCVERWREQFDRVCGRMVSSLGNEEVLS